MDPDGVFNLRTQFLVCSVPRYIASFNDSGTYLSTGTACRSLCGAASARNCMAEQLMHNVGSPLIIKISAHLAFYICRNFSASFLVPGRFSASWIALE